MARGDIYIVHLPVPQNRPGREQIGARPAIVVQADSSSAHLPTTIIVPMTSQRAALRFPHTIEVQHSPQNGLSAVSVLLVFQLRAIDNGRLSRRLGRLEDHYIDQLEDEMRAVLNLG